MQTEFRRKGAWGRKMDSVYLRSSKLRLTVIESVGVALLND